MQYKVKIDVRPIVSKMWNEYDGEVPQNKWLSTIQHNIVKLIKDKLNEIELNRSDDIQIKFSKQDKEIILIFEWKEKENIHYWMNEAKEDIKNIVNHLWSKGISAYHNIA